MKNNTLYSFVYWSITVIGMLSILILSYTSVLHYNNTIAYNEQVREVDENPTSKYFLYHSIQSKKAVYWLGEPISFFSDRNINPYMVEKNLAIWWKDTLYCDYLKGDWYNLISSKKRDNPNPTPREWEKEEGRKYEGTLPQNPLGTYVIADCYIRAYIETMDMWISKSQWLVSNSFEIRALQNN
jgi:hypothetical protein